MVAGLGFYALCKQRKPEWLRTPALFGRALLIGAAAVGADSLLDLVEHYISRVHETEADQLALQRITSVEELQHLRQYLQERGDAHASYWATLNATHPCKESRIAKIDARIAELSQQAA